MAQTARPAPPPAGALDLRYSIDAARPPTSMRLHLPASGDAELLLATSPLPVATDVLGHFRAPVDAALRARIERHVRERGLFDADRGEAATAEGSGTVTLSDGDRRVVLGLATSDPDVRSLRALLDEVVAAVARQPVRAVRLEVSGRVEGSTLVPQLAVVHVGTEPLELLLVELPAFFSWASVTARAGGREVSEGRLVGDAVSALGRSGQLPVGPFALARGQTVTIPMPPLSLPAAPAGPVELSAELGLWFVGPGRARTNVILRAVAPLTPATAAGVRP